MKFKVKGFPTQVSEEIQLPDMAELLMAPIFYDISIEEFYKYANPFQKELASKLKLSGTKKYVTVLSEVRVLTPDTRCCTHFNDICLHDSFKEWHIDCEEEPDSDELMLRIYEENDIVHILSSECSGMTEFNTNEFEVEIDPDNPANSFYDYISANRHLVKGQIIPPNRIITFTNHLHRAVKPERVEFRYFFRVVETDRKRPPSMKAYNPHHITHVINAKGERINNIQQSEDHLKIFIPQYVKERLNYRGGLYSEGASKVVEPIRVDSTINEDNNMELSIHIKGFDLETLPDYGWTFTPKIELFDVQFPMNFFSLPLEIPKTLDENGNLVISTMIRGADVVHLIKGHSYGIRQPNSEAKYIISTTNNNYFNY